MVESGANRVHYVTTPCSPDVKNLTETSNVATPGNILQNFITGTFETSRTFKLVS